MQGPILPDRFSIVTTNRGNYGCQTEDVLGISSEREVLFSLYPEKLHGRLKTVCRLSGKTGTSLHSGRKCRLAKSRSDPDSRFLKLSLQGAWGGDNGPEA